MIGGLNSMGSIAENLRKVNENIALACEKAGRNRDDVTLISVSKTKPVSMLMEAYDAGVRVFGENKVQELVDKYEQMPKDVHWHMIGHLQRNKVKYIIDKVDLIHGVDTIQLAEEISKQAVKHNVKANILIEVNIGDEESKFGVSIQDAYKFAEDVYKLPNICLRGLMCVAPNTENPEENRKYFQKMYKMCVDINHKIGDNNVVNILSMGMTGDYQVAVEEGATMVRVGTGIFGERDYSKI